MCTHSGEHKCNCNCTHCVNDTNSTVTNSTNSTEVTNSTNSTTHKSFPWALESGIKQWKSDGYSLTNVKVSTTCVTVPVFPSLKDREVVLCSE